LVDRLARGLPATTLDRLPTRESGGSLHNFVTLRPFATADHQISNAFDDGGHDAMELLEIQAGIGIHHRHDRRSCGQQTRMAGRAVAPLWRSNYVHSMIMGDHCGAIGGPVIDHDRPYPWWHPPEDSAKCLGLIETRQDDVDLKGQRTDHAFDATVGWQRSHGRIAFDSLTLSGTTARRCSRCNPGCLG
jgi:hypothetical protein